MIKNKKYRKVKKGKSNKNLTKSIIHDLKILGLIIIVLSAFALLSLINSVTLIEPSNNKVIYDRTPEFKWISRYNYFKFYLSNDKDFRNLIVSEEVYGSNYKINQSLYFGEYYWKVIAIKNNKEISSSVGKFKIDSVVATEINETLKNVGNTKVDVEISNDAGITGSAVLDVNEEIPIRENNTLYKVRQNE